MRRGNQGNEMKRLMKLRAEEMGEKSLETRDMSGEIESRVFKIREKKEMKEEGRRKGKKGEERLQERVPGHRESVR